MGGFLLCLAVCFILRYACGSRNENGKGKGIGENIAWIDLPEEFAKVARKEEQPTDKVTTHSYQMMYGLFLVPLLHSNHRKSRGSKPFKMLEIGLGCNMKYGPGKSVALWKKLLESEDSLWEAEVDEACVNSFKDTETFSGVNVLTGNQSDQNVLTRWIKESNADQEKEPFEVIIDDGAHENREIYDSFNGLFDAALAPGGLYFIEDMHVGRLDDWKDNTGEGVIMIEVIKDWQEQLVTAEHANASNFKHKILSSIAWIACFPHACVIAKKKVL
jgi:hypothetical protein